MATVKNDDRMEFLGSIIDIFEDFLENKNINIENPEKDDEEDAAIIYGSDYDELQGKLENMMRNWEIIE